MRTLRTSWSHTACWLALVALTLGTVTARGQDPRSFIPLITDAASGNLLGLASDLLGFAESLFGPSAQDTIEIITQRIDALQTVIEKDFQNLGAQLDQEVNRVINELKTEYNDDAVSEALAAESNLKLYKLTGDKMWLGFAGDDSAKAIFRLELMTDPFYIGGLICAGNARIDFLRAFDPDWANNPALTDDVIRLIHFLEGMINTVRQSVESEHTVVLFYVEEVIPNPHGSGEHIVTVYYYGHFHRALVISSFPVKGRGGPQAAQAAAEQDRLKGIQEELAFMSIPQFELTLQTWKELISAQ
jgi:hypothetical protein